MLGRTKILIGLLVAFALVGLFVRFGFGAGPDPTRGPDATAVALGTPLPRATTTPTPDKGPVKISILTTDTKFEWLDAVTKEFNAASPKTTYGRLIQVEILREGGPGDSEQKILAGTLQPVLWSPSDLSGLAMVNQVLKDRGQAPLVSGNVKDKCPPVVYVPTGFAMQRPMAEALGWPDKPIGWKQIIELASDPHGWDRYGHSEWRQFTFGHSHPQYSSTGFGLMASLAYAAAGKIADLTPSDVKSEKVKDAFRKVEKNTYQYGTSTTALLNPMEKYGPTYLHAAMASETAVLYPFIHKRPRDYYFVFVFPAEGTYWLDNPTCILEASWVNVEQQEAAKTYRNFLLSSAAQNKAVKIGLRPAIAGIDIDCPICLNAGTDPHNSPQTVPPLQPVSGATHDAIIDVFKETKKKATTLVLLDTSTTMQGEKWKNALAGSLEFLKQLDRDDEIFVYIFSDTVMPLPPMGRVGEVEEELSKRLGGVYPKGKTVLYDAVCMAATRVEQLRAEDETAREPRLYGIVLLSDGQDTDSKRTLNDMLSLCLPTGEDVRTVKVYTIGYGDDADKDLLTRIATRTNGKFYEANPQNIKDIYLKISAEQ